jgi:hypothetical protein
MMVKPLSLILSDWLKVSAEGMPPLLERKIHERLVFTNPDYEARHNRGEWIGNIPPQISCMRQKGRTYLLPRGFLDQFIDLCKRLQQPFRIVDRRRSLDLLPIEFHGQLKSYQQDAAEAVLDHDFSTLVGGHKSGKTVIALYTIAQRRQPTLVLIPKQDLLANWLTKIENFLQIPKAQVGVIAGGVQQVGKAITIAHTGEILRHWRKVHDQIGYLILDDCQRCPSKVLTHLVPNFDTRYTLGLCHSTQRKDKLAKLVYYYLGDVAYTINEKDAKEGRGVIPAHVVARPTEFEYAYNSRSDYGPMIQALVSDRDRTRLIVDDIENELKQGSKLVMVLTEGDNQSSVLRKELVKRGIKPTSLSSLDTNKPIEEDKAGSIAAQEACELGLGTREESVVLVDDKAMIRCGHQLRSKVLFLAVPTYFHQALSNAIRDLSPNGTMNESRRIKIYDYVDQRVGLLENYFRMRSYNYGVHPDVLLASGLN